MIIYISQSNYVKTGFDGLMLDQVLNSIISRQQPTPIRIYKFWSYSCLAYAKGFISFWPQENLHIHCIFLNSATLLLSSVISQNDWTAIMTYNGMTRLSIILLYYVETSHTPKWYWHISINSVICWGCQIDALTDLTCHWAQRQWWL